MPNDPTLLVIGHPGHKLRSYEWMRKTRPTVLVLTDGGGAKNHPRIERTRGVVTQAGAVARQLFCTFTDRDLYRFLIDGTTKPLVVWTSEVATTIRIGRPMALRQATAERGGSRGATAGTDRAGCGPTVEVPKSFLSTLKAGFVSSALARLETALLAGRPHRGMGSRQRLWKSITGSSAIRRLKECPAESGPERARPSRRVARGRETRAAARAVRPSVSGSSGSALAR